MRCAWTNVGSVKQSGEMEWTLADFCVFLQVGQTSLERRVHLGKYRSVNLPKWKKKPVCFESTSCRRTETLKILLIIYRVHYALLINNTSLQNRSVIMVFLYSLLRAFFLFLFFISNLYVCVFIGCLSTKTRQTKLHFNKCEMHNCHWLSPTNLHLVLS